jgi:ankyrin repeat protein
MELLDSIKNRTYYTTLKILLDLKNNRDLSISVLRELDVENNNPLDLAIIQMSTMSGNKLSEFPEFMNYLVDDLTPLCKLITQREDVAICKLIRYPKNSIDYTIIGKYGTALHTAVNFCAYDVAEELLDVGSVDKFINTKNRENLTPLDIAIIDGSGSIGLKIFKKGGIMSPNNVEKLFRSESTIIRDILCPILWIMYSKKINHKLALAILRYLN